MQIDYALDLHIYPVASSNYSEISFLGGEGGYCGSYAHCTPNVALNKLCFLHNLFEVPQHIKMHILGWCQSPAWSILDETITKSFGGSETLTSIPNCGEMRECNVNIKPESHLCDTHTHTHTHTQNKTKQHPSLKLVSVAITDAFYKSSGM